MDPLRGFKRPSGDQSCSCIKARRPPEQCRHISDSFCTSCRSQALEKTRAINPLVTHPKVKSSGAWSGRAVLPAAARGGGVRTLQGCLRPSGWRRSRCHLIGMAYPRGGLRPAPSSPRPLVPAVHSTSLCSTAPPVTCHVDLLAWTVSLRGSCQQPCPQDCFSRYGYRFNLLKICHKEK